MGQFAEARQGGVEFNGRGKIPNVLVLGLPHYGGIRMGYIADKSRQQRPLWEMIILVAFFVGLALLCRVPAELGKHKVAAGLIAPQSETVQAQRTGKE
jgi:hypothetical protein